MLDKIKTNQLKQAKKFKYWLFGHVNGESGTVGKFNKEKAAFL